MKCILGFSGGGSGEGEGGGGGGGFGGIFFLFIRNNVASL